MFTGPPSTCESRGTTTALDEMPDSLRSSFSPKGFKKHCEPASPEELLHSILLEPSIPLQLPAVVNIVSRFQGASGEEDGRVLFAQALSRIEPAMILLQPPHVVAACFVLVNVELLIRRLPSNLRYFLRDAHALIRRLTFKYREETFLLSRNVHEPQGHAIALKTEETDDTFFAAIMLETARVAYHRTQDGASLLTNCAPTESAELPTLSQKTAWAVKASHSAAQLARMCVISLGSYLAQRITVVARDQDLLEANWGLRHKAVECPSCVKPDVLRRQLRSFDPLIKTLEILVLLVHLLLQLRLLTPVSGATSNQDYASLRFWLFVAQVLKAEFSALLFTTLRFFILGVSAACFSVDSSEPSMVADDETSLYRSPALGPSREELSRWLGYRRPIVSIDRRIRDVREEGMFHALSVTRDDAGYPLVQEIRHTFKTFPAPSAEFITLLTNTGLEASAASVKENAVHGSLTRFRTREEMLGAFWFGVEDPCGPAVSPETPFHTGLSPQKNTLLPRTAFEALRTEPRTPRDRCCSPRTYGSPRTVSRRLEDRDKQALAEQRHDSSSTEELIRSPTSSVIAAFDSDFFSLIGKRPPSSSLSTQANAVAPRSSLCVESTLPRDAWENSWTAAEAAVHGVKETASKYVDTPILEKRDSFSPYAGSDIPGESALATGWGGSASCAATRNAPQHDELTHPSKMEALGVKQPDNAASDHHLTSAQSRRCPSVASGTSLERTAQPTITALEPGIPASSSLENAEPPGACSRTDPKRSQTPSAFTRDTGGFPGALKYPLPASGALRDTQSPEAARWPRRSAQSPETTQWPTRLTQTPEPVRWPLRPTPQLWWDDDTSPARHDIARHPPLLEDRAAGHQASGPAKRYEWEVDHSELQLIKKIGSGGTSKVYSGWWRGTEVAVKKRRTCMGGDSVSAHDDKFQREIRILLKLRHPHLTLLMGAGIQKKPYFVLMEYCPGGDLFTLLHVPEKSPHRVPRLTGRQKLKIAVDIARGMIYLHRSQPQIVHRDLKSLNILLANILRGKTDEPHAKITDFGLSQLRHEAEGERLHHTAAVGTFHWMAPEVLLGKPYNETVDVYSYGILLYEIFSETIPYTETPGAGDACPRGAAGHDGFPDPSPRDRPSTSGDNDAPSPTQQPHSLSLALAIAHGRRPNLARIPRNCPPALLELMTACWAAEASERPSFEHILESLLHVTAQFSSQAQPIPAAFPQTS